MGAHARDDARRLGGTRDDARPGCMDVGSGRHRLGFRCPSAMHRGGARVVPPLGSARPTGTARTEACTGNECDETETVAQTTPQSIFDIASIGWASCVPDSALSLTFVACTVCAGCITFHDVCSLFSFSLIFDIQWARRVLRCSLVRVIKLLVQAGSSAPLGEHPVQAARPHGQARRFFPTRLLPPKLQCTAVAGEQVDAAAAARVRARLGWRIQ